MAASHFDLQLEELRRKSVGRLLTADVFDLAAFEELKAYLWEKAEQLRAEFVVSKQILSCPRSASNAIQSRAEYLPKVREHVAFSEEFARLLDAIIAGEVKNDRTPGVPRIL